ncbi:lipopolysaccharide assembly protein LapB [Oceaniserpentilla sp. 4NH20-0058]|uniref:tetratricopeptide repeat protein n=1 Tax=Oceaniserpentilla sp. 4NH20-0058 TaxID=3127660 RepID=UPI00310B4BDC
MDLQLLGILVLAIALGWILGRQEGRKKSNNQAFPSLDMLAGDRQSETMQAILSMAEREEALDLQLSLGTFYRRRGEIDKAISIHQSLFARPDLDKKLSAEIQLALASDYLNAGLLDRAERLLKELLKANTHLKSKVLTQLITLYEEEQDWQSILELAHEAKHLKKNKAIAYACCELADDAMNQQNWRDANRYIQRALKLDARCVRALLLEANLAEKEGIPNKMLASIKEALSYDPSLLAVVLPQLKTLFEQRHRPQELERLLEQEWQDHPMPLSLHSYVQHIATHQGLDQAIEKLTECIVQVPTYEGFSLLLDNLIEKGEALSLDYVKNLKHIMLQLQQSTDDYICRQCGFDADQHHWRCPSCKEWETFIPKLAYIHNNKLKPQPKVRIQNV